jgi:hypothetical protein
MTVALGVAIGGCGGGRAETPVRTASPPATLATAAPSSPTAASPPPPTESPTTPPTRTPPPLVIEAPAPTAPPSEASTPSEMEERLARAKLLEPMVAAIAAEADAVGPDFARYVSLCHDKYARHKWEPPATWPAGRPWFALARNDSDLPWQETWTIRFLPFNETEIAQCRDLWTATAYGAARVFQRLDDLEDHARRHSVLPGHLRDLLERHHLLR